MIMNYYPNRGRTSFPCPNQKARTLGNTNVSEQLNLKSSSLPTIYFKKVKLCDLRGNQTSILKKTWNTDGPTNNIDSSNKVRISFWLRAIYYGVRLNSSVTKST